MAAMDIVAAAAILKRTYANGVVTLDYKNSKTLAMLKKNKGSLTSTPFGEGFVEPVKHGNPQAGSATYATGYAQSANESSRYKAWFVTPATNYQFARWNGDVTRRAVSTGAFVDAAVKEIENAKDAMTRLLEIQLFKSGFGAMGSLSAAANVASATGVLLAQPWMVRFLENGMSLVASLTESANTLRSATPIKVTGRHVAAGTVDLSATPTSQSWVAGDTIFRDGDRQNSATPTRLLASGFPAWLPPVAPTATLFNAVDRTLDDRLGGLRQDATLSGSIEEAFMDAATLVSAEGGTLTHVVTGPTTYNRLAKSMLNRYDNVEYETDVGVIVDGLRIKGQDAMIYADNAMEEGLAYGFNIDEVEIRYAGEDLCYMIEDDGLPFRRVAGSDEWLSELVSCWNLILPAPGHGVNIFNL